MPKKTTSKKKSTKARSSRSRASSFDLNEPMEENFQMPAPQPTQSGSNFKRVAVGVIAVVVVAAIILRSRGWFIAATVNGVPISKGEYNKTLNDRYGNQVLESLIGEKLIVGEADKQHISVTDADIQARIDEVAKTLSGGMKIEDALKLQGITMDAFKEQIKVQLLVDKLLSKDVSVSASEVDDFVQNNSSLLTSSDPAQMREEAQKEIMTSKISSKFQDWFAALRKDAKVTKYL